MRQVAMVDANGRVAVHTGKRYVELLDTKPEMVIVFKLT
jgi:hypothetical protein